MALVGDLGGLVAVPLDTGDASSGVIADEGCHAGAGDPDWCNRPLQVARTGERDVSSYCEKQNFTQNLFTPVKMYSLGALILVG